MDAWPYGRGSMGVRGVRGVRRVRSGVVRGVGAARGVRWRARSSARKPPGRGDESRRPVRAGARRGAATGDGVDGVHADERVGRAGGDGWGRRSPVAEGGVGGAPDVPAVGGGDDQPAAAPAQDEVVVVDEAVIGVAEQHEVGQVGAAAVQPVPHVVGVQPFDAGLRAAGPGAAAVAAQQGPALGGGGAALAAADGQRFASLLQHDHGGGLAEHAAGLRAGDRRAALVVRASGRGVLGEHVGVDVHHDLATRRVTGAAVDAHAGRGERAEGVNAAGGGALAGQADGLVAGTALGHVAVHPAAGGADLLVTVLGPLVLRAFPAGVAFGEGVDRDHEGGAGLGGHPDLEGQPALVVGPRLEGLPDPRPPIQPRVLVVDASPGPAEPLGLRRGRRGRELQQRRLAVGGGDAGQRPHLGVGQPAGGERGRDLRQPAQRPGHPHVLACGDRRHAALPGQPVRAGIDPRSVPAAALVELGHQPQPRRGRRRQPHRPRGDRPGQLRQTANPTGAAVTLFELMFGSLGERH